MLLPLQLLPSPIRSDSGREGGREGGVTAQQTKPGERGAAGAVRVPRGTPPGASAEQMSRKINSPDTWPGKLS